MMHAPATDSHQSHSLSRDATSSPPDKFNIGDENAWSQQSDNMDLSQAFVIHRFRFISKCTQSYPHSSQFHFPPSPALLLRLFLPGDEGLAVARADAHVGEDLLWSQMDGYNVCGLVGDLLLEFL